MTLLLTHSATIPPWNALPPYPSGPSVRTAQQQCTAWENARNLYVPITYIGSFFRLTSQMRRV